VQIEPFLRSSLRGAAFLVNSRKPRIRSRAWTIPSFFSAWVHTEAAGLFLGFHLWRVARALRRGEHRSPQGRLAMGLQAVTIAGLVKLVDEGRHVDDEFEAALSGHLTAAELDARPRSVRTGLFAPHLMVTDASKRTVERNVAYHDEAGWRHTLDVYRPLDATRDGSTKRPVVVEIHGGGWVVGNKNQQGLQLLNHLAGEGWVGFNVNYRLAPRAKFPEQLIDCKRALAWVRAHAADYGGDPDFIVVTGGSAGGYLTAMMALTANDPEFQPGFEDADTTVQAAVPFYGVYDLLDRGSAMAPGFTDFLRRIVVGTDPRTDADRWARYSPIERVHADAPPMLMVHGTHDTLVPVEQGRAFAAELRRASDHAVLYAELAGANHAFDVFPSPRSVRTVEWVERFLDGVHRGQIK